jgi:hypothetical protein
MLERCSKIVVAVLLLLLIFRRDARRQHTVTLLFSDERYAEMTCAAAAQVLEFGGKVELFEIGGRPNATCFHVMHTLNEDNHRLRCYSKRDGRGESRRNGDAAIGYYELIAQRLAIVIDRLQNAPADVCGYLVLDSDVALYSNIGEHMSSLDVDLVFQAELPIAAGAVLLPPINGGVWWVRARDAKVLRVLRHALHLMQKLHLPDQDALQIALREHAEETRWIVIGPPFFINGFTHIVGHRRIDPQLVRLVHANWAPNIETKTERLAVLGVVERHRRCFAREYPVPVLHEESLARPVDALSPFTGVDEDVLCELAAVLSSADSGHSTRNDSLRLAAQCYTTGQCKRALHLDPTLRSIARRCAMNLH